MKIMSNHATGSPVHAIQKLSGGLAEDLKQVMVQMCPPGCVLMLGATSKRVRELLAQRPMRVAVRVVDGDCWMKSVVTGLEQLQRWCSVVTLDLRNLEIGYSWTGGDTQELGNVLGQCSALTSLVLGGGVHELVNALEQPLELLAEGLGQCSSLADLSLEGCCTKDWHAPEVSASFTRSIAGLLRQCPWLTKLNLSKNRIAEDGAGSLAEVLSQCYWLADLNLRENEIGEGGVRSLAGVLGQCSSLAKLDLGNNRLGEEGARSLAGVIFLCSSLSVLDLAWNDIGFRGTRSLARVLGRCHSLAELYLDRNRIGAEGARSLARLLGQSSSLALLTLEGNSFGSEGMRRLIDAVDLQPGMGQCSSLTTLNLENNLIGGDDAGSLEGMPVQHFSLIRLNLRNNRINAEGAKTLAGVVLCSGSFAQHDWRRRREVPRWGACAVLHADRPRSWIQQHRSRRGDEPNDGVGAVSLSDQAQSSRMRRPSICDTIETNRS